MRLWNFQFNCSDSPASLSSISTLKSSCFALLYAHATSAHISPHSQMSPCADPQSWSASDALTFCLACCDCSARVFADFTRIYLIFNMSERKKVDNRRKFFVFVNECVFVVEVNFTLNLTWCRRRLMLQVLVTQSRLISQFTVELNISKRKHRMSRLTSRPQNLSMHHRVHHGFDHQHLISSVELKSTLGFEKWKRFPLKNSTFQR